MFHYSPFSCLFIFHLSRVFHFSPFSGFFVLLYRECYGFGRAFFTLRRLLPYTPSRHLAQPAFIKASLGAGSSFLKVAGPPTEVRNTDLAHLFESHRVQLKVLVGRFHLLCQGLFRIIILLSANPTKWSNTLK